jgi:hypothetical protein
LKHATENSRILPTASMHHRFSSSTTAVAAMPRPLPTQPSFSVVGGFDVNALHGDVDLLRDGFPHRSIMWRELGFLSDQPHVRVDELIPFPPHQPQRAVK